MMTEVSPTIIVAATRDMAIGRNGDLLYHISDDLKRFKTLTMGHPIIMGRRTFESFPKGALPGRRNMVITRNSSYSAPGIEIFPSLEAALEAAGDAEPFILGGGEIYRQALPLSSKIELTLIDALAPDADTVLDGFTSSDWQLPDGTIFDPSAITFTNIDPRTSTPYAFLTLTRR